MSRTYYLHYDPHEFETANGRAKDWGHWLRTAELPWRWWHRVLAWNPCNNIGQLYDCPVPPPVQRPPATDARANYVFDNVIPEVYDDNKTDEEIIVDGFWNMFDREERAFAEYRKARKNRRRY